MRILLARKTNYYFLGSFAVCSAAVTIMSTPRSHSGWRCPIENKYYAVTRRRANRRKRNRREENTRGRRRKRVSGRVPPLRMSGTQTCSSGPGSHDGIVVFTFNGVYSGPFRFKRPRRPSFGGRLDVGMDGKAMIVNKR